MTTEELLKNSNIEEIVTKGSRIYEEIRHNYEPAHTGEFLAIEVESKKEYLSSTSAEAIVAARADNPNKVFYVVKIGFDAAETLAHLYPSKK